MAIRRWRSCWMGKALKRPCQTWPEPPRWRWYRRTWEVSSHCMKRERSPSRCGRRMRWKWLGIEAGGEDAHGQSVADLLEECEEGLVVGGLVEDLGAVVAAVGDVVDDVGSAGAGGAGHGAERSGNSRLGKVECPLF